MKKIDQKKLLWIVAGALGALLIALIVIMLGGKKEPEVVEFPTTTQQGTLQETTTAPETTDTEPTTENTVETTVPVESTDADTQTGDKKPTNPSKPTKPAVTPGEDEETEQTQPTEVTTTPSTPVTSTVPGTTPDEDEQPETTQPTESMTAPTEAVTPTVPNTTPNEDEQPASTQPTEGTTAPTVPGTTPYEDEQPETTQPTEGATTPSAPVAPTTPDDQPEVTQPTEGTTTPTAPTTPATPETTPTEPEQPQRPTVPPVEEEEGDLVFPCVVEEYDLVIEKMASYTGLYVEDGTNNQCTDVAMLLVHNNSQQPLEYTQITIEFPSETLEFYLSALPAGQRVVVQERSAKAVPASGAKEAKVMLVQQAEMSVSPEISVRDNGDNSITVENLTGKEIQTVRVFYKYYMEEENLYVGGIAFTAKIGRLPAGGKMVIRPSHYISQTSRVVMAQTYDA